MGINPDKARLIVYRDSYGKLYEGYEGYGDDMPVDGGLHELMSSDILFVRTGLFCPYDVDRYKYQEYFGHGYVGGASHFYSYRNIELRRNKFRTPSNKFMTSWLPKEASRLKSDLVIDREYEVQTIKSPILKRDKKVVRAVFSGVTIRFTEEERDRWFEK